MSVGWAFNHPVARKEHHCDMCRRRIDPGEQYLRGAGFDGTAWTWKECFHCETVRKRYDIDRDGEYGEDSFDTWCEEARDLPELRAVAGYLHGWRTKSGALWPLPDEKESHNA